VYVSSSMLSLICVFKVFGGASYCFISHVILIPDFFFPLTSLFFYCSQ